MAVKRIVPVLLAVVLMLGSVQAVNAEIKVENGDCPVYISNHQMGSQIVKDRNGNLSIYGLILGYVAPKFPLETSFKTIVTFSATRKYQTEYASIVLSDSLGKNKLANQDFKMFFQQEGMPYAQVSDWKVSFPKADFYAFNIFVDGKLVGYYPFYVGQK